MAKRVLVAMSGGVDSSVAAYMLKRDGYDCVGITMKLFGNDGLNVSNDHTCCSLSDVEDARSVARSLGLPHYVFNFTENFREEVIERFVCSYEAGMTPNPCIECNRYMKFHKLYDRAKDLGMDFMATGHYARIEYDKKSGRYLLKKAADASKDQSYVLYMMTQQQLAHTLFPLGMTEKARTREIAEKAGFVNADKHDSQDICFVPDGDYADFIERYRGKVCPEGPFVDEYGREAGRHKGIIRYTIGQRKGLGIAMGKPVYVYAKDVNSNSVYIGDEDKLYSYELEAGNVNWIACDRLEYSMRVKAKTRYRQKEKWATVYPSEKGFRLRFDEPQRAVSAGQAVVLYDGDVVVGGGTITDRII